MIISLTPCLHAEELEAGEQDRMSARHFLENHWPSITIAVTATAIACAFLVMLRSMPPHQIVMATGREGDAYYEIGERYRAALSDENVQVQLVPTAGSVENLAICGTRIRE